MSKPGKHARKYDQYRSSGNKERNKKARAVRNEKRIERFNKRREEGLCYKYDSTRAKAKLIEAGYNPNSEYYKDNEFAIRKEVYGSDHKTETSKRTSTLRKLDNMLAAKKAEEKIKNGYGKDKSAPSD